MYGELVVDVPATCTETGNAHYDCAVCGLHRKYVVPVLGHDFKLIEIKALCAVDGKAYEECTRCGIVRNEKVLYAHGHDFDPKTDICKICKAHKYTLVIKYQLSDNVFADQYAVNKIMGDGDPIDSQIVLHNIAGYTLQGVYFDSVDDYVITIVVKYKAK
jgi:hypothetical protein